MAKKSKRELIREGFAVMTENDDLSERLNELSAQKRVTTGYYMVENEYDSVAYKGFMDLVDRVNKSKTSIGDYPVYRFTSAIAELKAFYAQLRLKLWEQEMLPFEETQMQICKREGTLQVYDNGVLISGPTDEEKDDNTLGETDEEINRRYSE